MPGWPEGLEAVVIEEIPVHIPVVRIRDDAGWEFIRSTQAGFKAAKQARATLIASALGYLRFSLVTEFQRQIC